MSCFFQNAYFPRYRSEGQNILKLFFEKIFNFCLFRELLYEEVEIINSFDIVFEFVVKTQFIDE